MNRPIAGSTHLPHWLSLPHQRRGKRRHYGPTPEPEQPHHDCTSSPGQYALAQIIIAVITLACFMMAFGMAEGLPANPDISSRLAYLSAHTTRWQFGWLTWMASAIGLLAYCILLAQHIPYGSMRSLGITLVAIGIAPDISAEMLYAFVLPGVQDQDTFLLIDRIAMLLTGFVGNGAYCLGGLVLNLALLRNPTLARPMLYFGLPSWLFGLLISVSTALNQIPSASLFTAIAMVWNVLWMFWFAQSVLRRPAEVTRYV